MKSPDEMRKYKREWARNNYWSNPIKARAKHRLARAADPEKNRAYERDWYERNKEKAVAAKKRWRMNNPDKMREIAQRFREAHRAKLAKQAREHSKANREKWNAIRRASYRRAPEKFRARNELQKAIREKRITKPRKCSRCGHAGVVHGHHHKGYEKAHWLDVLWLCQPCHVIAERG